MSDKKAIACNYTIACNGIGDCTKCPHLKHLKIIDLGEQPPETDNTPYCMCG